MFNGLINWFRQKSNFIFPKNDIVEAQAVAPTVKTTKNKTYLVDPSLPSLIIEKEIPTTTILPVNAIGESGGGYSLGTSQQQAAGLKQIINDALIFMSGKSPKKIVKWAATSRLSLQARAGKDINAYYDRSSLKFFYFPDKKTNKTIYACDSRTVVAHEFGHALPGMASYGNRRSLERSHVMVWLFGRNRANDRRSKCHARISSLFSILLHHL